MVNVMEVSNSPANSTNDDMHNITDTNDGSASHLSTLPRELELKTNLPANHAEFMLQQNFNLTLICIAKQQLNAGHKFGPFTCKISPKQPNSNCSWKVSFFKKKFFHKISVV